MYNTTINVSLSGRREQSVVIMVDWQLLSDTAVVSGFVVNPCIGLQGRCKVALEPMREPGVQGWLQSNHVYGHIPLPLPLVFPLAIPLCAKQLLDSSYFD